MNGRSMFGQMMTVLIFVIPAGILLWVVSLLGSTKNGSNIITGIATWTLIVIVSAIVLYLVTLKIWEHREKVRTGAVGVRNLFRFKSPENDGGTWWSEKTTEEKRWVLYAALAAIAIGVVYIVDPTPDSPYRNFVIAGGVVLIGLHVVIWPFFTDKTSFVAKLFITGFLVFFVAAIAFPDTVKIMRAVHKVTEVKMKQAGVAATKWADDVESGKATTQEASQVPALAAQTKTTSSPMKRITLTREWSAAVVSPPSGGTMRFYCTPGAQMKIDYSAAKNSLVSPGEPFLCPQQGEDVRIGKMFVNARYYFQADNGGEAVVEYGG